MQPVVTDRVAWSVGRFVTVVSPAKMAQAIKSDGIWIIQMPFGLRPRVGSRTMY